MECDILIKNVSVLTKDFEINSNQTVAIQDSQIIAIGSSGSFTDGQYLSSEVIDGKGKLLMPGMVDGHTHTCQQYLRGRTADEYPMVWARILVPFESNLTEDDVYEGAKLSALEMIKSGTTSFAESGGMHMHRVVDATVEAGLRAAITYSTMDSGGFIPNSMLTSVEEAVSRGEKFYKEYQGAGEGRVDIWFALRQVMTSTPELVQAMAEKAREYNTGLHTHLAEHRDEVKHCLQNYQKRPAEFLDSMGALGPNLLTAHNVLLSDGEISLLAERGVHLIHCPRNNYSSHGFPKTPTILHQGISVGLGSDGAASSSLSLFEEMRTLRSGMKAFWGLQIFDPTVMSAKELLKMATVGGAEAILHGEEIGVIEIGRKADLILIDIDQPHILPSHNLVNSLIETVTSADVKDVIIDGKIVMKNREVLTLDEEKILFESKNRLQSIAERAGL